MAILYGAMLNSAAQTGEIRGRVIEKETGESMTGVNIVIESLLAGASSDLDGNYSLNVAPGTYKLKISYISFNTVELNDVIVEAGKVTEVNVAMEESVVGFEEVVVTAVRRMNSEVQMLEAVKSSSMVVSGISSQQITRTQDRDASEVVKRIPGISIIDNKFIIARGLSQRYNNVWINNNAVPSSEADSRAFSFDMIPSGQIENIMIVKSPAPELPADFTGGFVKVATKNMPAENALQISYGVNFNTETQFNDFKYAKGSGTDFLGFDNGLRDMRSAVPSKRMVNDADNAPQISRVTREGFNNDWSVRSRRPGPDQRFSLMLNRHRKMTGAGQLGLVAALNYSYGSRTYTDMQNSRYGVYNKRDDQPEYIYKYSDNQYNITAKVGAMLNLTWMLNNNHRLEIRNIFNQTGHDRYTERDGYQNISSFYKQQKDEYRYSSRGAYTGQIGGNHILSEADKLDWTVGYSYANKNQPDRRIVNKEEETGSAAYNGLYRIDQNEITRDFIRLDENIYSVTINYNHQFDFGYFLPLLKAGVYTEYRERTYNTRYFEYRYRSANLPGDFIYRDVTSEIMIPENYGFDKFRIYDNTNNGNNYKGDDILASGYAGISLPIDKFNVYAGVRYENNNMRLTNYTTMTTDATKDYDYSQADFFPSVNATYNINQKNLLRFAYGQSINRQEFREVSPSSYYDFELFSFVQGNTELKPAYIQNFDLRYEIYPSKGELISLALFYKKFTNPIEWTYLDAGGSYTFTYENAQSAENFGVELDMKKNLDFIGLPNLTMSFNGAIIESNVIFGEDSREHDRPMQGQSPFLVNTGVFYQNNNQTLNIGLMYNIIGKRIVDIGKVDAGQDGSINNDIPDMYEMPRSAIDLSVSCKLGKYVELSAGVRDILAQNVVFKQFPKFYDDAGNIHEREQTTKEFMPGRNFALSVKINL